MVVVSCQVKLIAKNKQWYTENLPVVAWVINASNAVPYLITYYTYSQDFPFEMSVLPQQTKTFIIKSSVSGLGYSQVQPWQSDSNQSNYKEVLSAAPSL